MSTINPLTTAGNEELNWSVRDKSLFLYCKTKLDINQDSQIELSYKSITIKGFFLKLVL